MQYLPGDVAQWIGEEDAARRRQQQAQQLIQAGYNPVQGGNPLLAMLASVMSTVKGNSMLKDSDAKLSETLAKRFEYENQQAQAQAEAERAAADLAYERDLEKMRKGEEYKAQFRGPEKIDPLSPEGMRATLELERAKAAMQPRAERAQSELERKIAWLEANGVGKDAIANMVMGGGQSNAPSGYRAKPDGSLEPIPGGPADPAAKSSAPRQLPADMAGRVALAEEYLSNADAINSAIKSGALTGPIDNRTAAAGYGKGGEIFRQIQSGRDALQRTLTGAGMPASEASEYADRYLPTIGDTSETLLSKQGQLQAELGRFIKEARGITDTPSGTPAPKQQAGGTARPQTDADFAALPSGALYIDPDDGRTYRKP